MKKPSRSVSRRHFVKTLSAGGYRSFQDLNRDLREGLKPRGELRLGQLETRPEQS